MLNALQKIGKALLFIMFMLDVHNGFSQGLSEGFQKYRNNLIGPLHKSWHEIHFSNNLAYDINYKEKTEGNLKRGINYGFGIGYMFKVGLNHAPQNLGVGLKAEYYPNAFYKFNIMTDFKLLALGNQNFGGSFLGGWELNVSYNKNFTDKEMHTILYLLDLRYKNIEAKRGLQSWYDKIIPTTFVDHAFSVFKVTYKIIR